MSAPTVLHSILLRLSERPHTTAELARALRRASGRSSAAVQRALEAGYVVRHGNPRVRAAPCVYTITDDGRAALERTSEPDWPLAQRQAIAENLDKTDREIAVIVSMCGPVRLVGAVNCKRRAMGLHKPADLRAAATRRTNAMRAEGERSSGWPRVPPPHEADAVFRKALALEMQRLGMVRREAA